MIKIVLTGGGTGGHFYPLIAVAEKLKKVFSEKGVNDFQMYFLSPSAMDESLLSKNNIIFKKIISGKIRLYPSIQNIIDIIKMPFAIIQAIFVMFKIYPDVVFSKGGFGAFPIVFASRLLFIPVVMHESDTVPGKVNLFTGKFAKRIAVSYPETGKYFPLERVANTGQPIRESVQDGEGTPSSEIVLDEKLPLIFVIGGSQGSQIINENILGGLVELLKRYQIVHQTGDQNLNDVKMMADYLLKDNIFKNNYHPIAFLSGENQAYYGKKSTVVISRAGSAIFEIAGWGVPSIIIPITDSNGDHQRRNAFSYARKGGAIVIEERNLTSNILVSTIDRIISNPEINITMKKSASSSSTPGASLLIANEIAKIALSH